MKETHEVALPTIITDTTGIDLCSPGHDIISRGSILVSPELNISARNAIFEADILNHTIRYRSESLGIQFFGKSLVDGLRHGQSLGSALSLEDPLLGQVHGFIHSKHGLEWAANTINLGIEAFNTLSSMISGCRNDTLGTNLLQRYGLGDESGFNPKISLVYSVQNTKGSYQSLGPGGIYVGSLTVNATDTLTFGNAIPVHVMGDAEINARVVNQKGAQLLSSVATYTNSLSLGFNLKGVVDVGLSHSRSRSRDTQYVNQEMRVNGTETMNAKYWNLDAANNDSGRLNGSVDQVKITHRQDKHHATAMSVSVSSSGSASLHFAKEHSANVQKASGITIRDQEILISPPKQPKKISLSIMIVVSIWASVEISLILSMLKNLNRKLLERYELAAVQIRFQSI